MIVALQPKLRPKWAKDANGVFVPVLDADGGQQLVASPTKHQIFWPGDKTVSAISEKTWFSITKSENDTDNPVSGKYWFLGTNVDNTGKQLGPAVIKSDVFRIVQDWEWSTELPAGTKKITIHLDPTPNPVYVTLEVQAR